MDKPLRPGGGGTASTLPGRPGIDNRPGIGNRPGERPGLANRPGSGNRPDFGDRWNNNNVISSRPGWANIDNSTNVNIHNRWNSAFANTRNPGWWNRPANRIGYWHGWADGVRGSWGYYHRHNGWFNSGWWNRHYFPAGGWGYWYGIERYPSNYWWRVPAWTTLSSWFVWTAPTTAWSQPVYYDYGSGGNVTYENNNVYVGGEQVATEDEFAMSAMDLATVTPPASEEEAQSAEWMPLGTFAVSTDQKDVNPDLVIQLAVNKQGVISGSLYNVTSDQAQAVQGQVDKETQRVAFRIGESDSIVAETGLYNLTQNEAPVLVHFATERDENYLLVRLEQPEDGEQTVQEGTP